MKKILLILLLFVSVASFAQNTLSVFPPVASGTDTYTVTITGAPTTGGLPAMSTRMYFVKFTNANTGAATLNVNSLGADDLEKWNGTSWVAMEAGDIAAGAVIQVNYDGTRYQARTTAGGGGSGGNFIKSDGNTTLLSDILVDGDAFTYSASFGQNSGTALNLFEVYSSRVEITGDGDNIVIGTDQSIDIGSGGGGGITLDVGGTSSIEMANSSVNISGGGTASMQYDPHDLILDGGTGTISLIADNGAGQVVIDTDELIEGATTVTQTFGTVTTTATSSLVWDVASSTVEVVADAAGYALTSLNNIGHIADAGGGYNYAQSIQSSGTAINDEIFHIGVGGSRTYDLEINSSALLESTVWTDNGTGYQVSQGISASATASDMIFTVSSPTDNITFGMDNTHIYLGANSTEWFAVYEDGSISLNGDFGSAGEVITSAGPGAPVVWGAGGGGSGTVTNVSGTSPINVASGTTTPVISIDNAAADGTTKGAASFTATDFDASSGNVSIDVATNKAWTGTHSFEDNDFRIYNPAGTFYYSLRSSAIAGNRDLTIPLTTGADVFATLGMTQTFSGNISFSGTVSNDYNVNNGNVRNRILNQSTGTSAVTHFKIGNNTGVGTTTEGVSIALTGGNYSGSDYDTPGGGAFAIYHRENKPIIFGTNNARRLTILGSGEVGIGQSTPTARLHITAANNDEGLLVEDDAGNDALLVTEESGVRKVKLMGAATVGYVWTANATDGTGEWSAGVTLAGNNDFTGLNSFANAGTLKVSTALEVYDNTNLSSDFIGGIDKLADGFNYLKGVDHIRPGITSGASPVGVDLEVSGSDITSVSSGTGTTGSLVLQSGDASGSGNSNSGTVTIKAGTTTGTGVSGDIIILVTRTSCSGAVTGTLWNDSGTLKICP